MNQQQQQQQLTACFFLFIFSLQSIEKLAGTNIVETELVTI